MSSQSNQCEKCGEKYMDIYIKWCKPCHINYLKNNFTNWTSGNEKIDIFIQEMQLKIIYYSDIVVEWVPYNQFIDIIKIRNDDDNVATMYSTLWNNGPLNYDNNKKEWIRESNKRVILKYLTLDVDEFLNEAKNYSISNKIYGISQNPDTKVYILICQDEYCENCGKEYTDIFNWCKPCHINYLINNFTNWTSEDEKINNMIQKMQLAIDYYGQTVVEWVPFNQLIDIKEIKKGDTNVAIIYSALWNNGPLYYDNDERKWVRESNSKVTLKCLALDINEFLKEIKNYIINNVIYGISQNPNTKDYIIVCQDEYCGECGEQYTDMYTKWCKPCYINYLKDDFTNWSSGNKEIDIFIQGMQLAIDIFDRTIIEWIPYDQFINIKEVGIDIYTAIWNNGPLEFKKKRIRESNKKVTLKCLSLDINEFLNEVKNYIRLNYIYGISQNPNTKDYIIVCQDEQCEECGEQYADLNYNWCKSCHMTHLKNKFTNWTSGNEEIDIFIQEMQLNISNHYDIIVEWIPYNQLIDIKKMEYDNDGNDDVFTKYSAIWNNGPLNYDDYKKEWTRISNKEVALITLKILDSNSYNMIDEFLNKVKDYSNNPSDGIGIYGISQNPDTKNYIMVLQDQYCVKCGDNYIDLYNKWCKPCQINCLKNNFINWTSENEKIDDFIQEIQLKINRYDDIILEWIPYTQFYRVEKIDKGGFATVYSAIWKDGPLTYDRHKKKYVREYFKEVALKSLDNSQNITNEFINECWDPNPENRPNVESIGTILYDTNRLTLMDELEKAEKYLFDKGHREDDQLTTSPQTSYKSQVLNHYISEDLEAFDFTELDMKN
ncbi:unnamed protein product [Rhizophagus irregularis]|nr:unnamed protein product [Rhizophagus irregularis]